MLHSLFLCLRQWRSNETPISSLGFRVVIIIPSWNLLFSMDPFWVMGTVLLFIVFELVSFRVAPSTRWNVFIHKMALVGRAQLSDLSPKTGPQTICRTKEWAGIRWFLPLQSYFRSCTRSLASFNEFPTLPVAHFLAPLKAISNFSVFVSRGNLGRQWQPQRGLFDLLRFVSEGQLLLFVSVAWTVTLWGWPLSSSPPEGQSAILCSFSLFMMFC